MNMKLLIENLKSGDNQIKLQSMQELMTAGNSGIDMIISELSKIEDAAIYWALDGMDYSEEIAVKHPYPKFELLQNTMGLKKWYVLAYTKILISYGSLSSSKLLLLLKDEQTALNAMIALIVGIVGDKSAIPILINRLKLSATPEKIRVVQSLGRLRSEIAVEYLHSLLPIDELTFEVAVALGRIGDRRSVDPLVEQFRRDPKTAHVTGAALVKLGDVAVEPFIKILADADAKQVNALAAEILGILGDKRAASSLIDLLEQTSDHTTRHRILVALGNLRELRAFSVVERFMLHPQGVNDRYAATQALASINYDRAFDLFTRLLTDKSQDFLLRCHALFGYRLLGKVHDIQPLLDAVSDPDARIRSTAVVQLASSQDERARTTLESVLNDPDWSTRVWAREALKRMDAHYSEK